MTDHDNPGFKEAKRILYDCVVSGAPQYWFDPKNPTYYLDLAMLTLIEQVERLQTRVDELESRQQKTPPPTEK